MFRVDRPVASVGSIGCIGDIAVPADLDRFQNELASLVVSHHWASWGLDLVRDSPWPAESFRRHGPPWNKLDELPEAVVIAVADDITRARQLAAGLDPQNRSMLARSTYILAWISYENLYSDCLREAFHRHPQRLVQTLKERGRDADQDFVRKFLTRAWTRSQALESLVGPELDRVRRFDPKQQANYARKHLSLDWPTWVVSGLERVWSQRNGAAHEPQFASPVNEDIHADIERLVRASRWVALKLKRRLGISVVYSRKLHLKT